MHKDDAAKLFAVLSDGTRVKILKKLYNNGAMHYNKLQEMFDCDIKESLKILEDNGFINVKRDTLCIDRHIIVENNEYCANKGMIDELMNFISTPCGCTK